MIDIDFDLDDWDISDKPKHVLKGLAKNGHAVHNDAELNRLIARETPTMSRRGILMVTNHRRTNKSIVALDFDEAARFPDFNKIFNKEIKDLVITLKKGGW